MDNEDIYNASLHFLEPLSLEKTYEVACDEVKKLFSAEYATVLLWEKDKLKRVYADSSVIARTEVRRKGRTFKAFKNQQPSISLIKSPQDIAKPQYQLGIRSIILIPLTYNEKRLGSLNLLSKEKLKLPDNHLILLKLLSSYISLAIYKARHYQEVLEALEKRDLFLAVASHELKTPLTTVSLYGQLIKAQIDKNKVPDTSSIDIQLKGIERVRKIVEELFEIHQIQTGQFSYHFRICNIHEIIERSVTDFKSAYQQEISFKDTLGKDIGYVLGDLDKLTQVLTNILNNAGKFSPPFSVIEIAISQEGKDLLISITDHGQGILKKDVENIFKKFFQSEKKGNQGIGLGLYITKIIIERHKGKIEVSSKVGGGTTFKVYLPLK